MYIRNYAVNSQQPSQFRKNQTYQNVIRQGTVFLQWICLESSYGLAVLAQSKINVMLLL